MRRAPIGAIRLEDGFDTVLGDDIGDGERAAEHAEVNRLIDEESGEGDVTGQRGGENDQRRSPAERSQRGPGVVLLRSLGPDRLGPELAQRVGDRDRSDERGHAPRGDRDVERGGGVGGRLDQPRDGPDRRNRHREAIDDRSRSVADRNEPPGRTSRGQHAASKRIDDDQHPRRFKRGVDEALHARIGKVEGVERAGQHAEAGERQRREEHEYPRGGERAAQPARSAFSWIPVDKTAGEPAERRGSQRQHDHNRRHADLSKHRLFADGVDPIADQAPHHLSVDRDFPPDGGPKLRIEDARRAGESSLREQLAPRRADARAQVVGFQHHGARGAQVGVEPVVPLFLGVEFLGRDVRRGRGLTRFGREFSESLCRGREAGGQVGDRSLQGEGERIALSPQALQARVVEVLVPERRFSGGQRRARLVEVEPMGFLRPCAPKPHEDEGENDPMQQAQCGRRLHRRLDGLRG